MLQGLVTTGQMMVQQILTMSELVSADRSEGTIAYIRRKAWVVEDGRLHDAGWKYNLVQRRVEVCLCDDKHPKNDENVDHLH